MCVWYVTALVNCPLLSVNFALIGPRYYHVTPWTSDRRRKTLCRVDPMTSRVRSFCWPLEVIFSAVPYGAPSVTPSISWILFISCTKLNYLAHKIEFCAHFFHFCEQQGLFRMFGFQFRGKRFIFVDTASILWKWFSILWQSRQFRE